jgi:hypothetical protein
MMVTSEDQEASINNLRKELAAQKTMAEVGKKEYRALQKLV